MTKKNTKNSNTKNNNTKINPFVSICTPTFNRRPFIPYMIKCFEHQNYPKDKIEWIIIDDGTDPIQDLVTNIPQVKYYYFNEKMSLGKKRNVMHTKCKGDIIVYMDDDDYYPPERISHAVETLQNNPSYLLAGSSEMHIYFNTRKQMYQCGPYKQYHSTAATFAFKKELLLQTSYDENVEFAEESSFTKKYTIPLIQLNTLKSILVFSHNHNSFNKETLLENMEQTKTKLSPYHVDDFIKDEQLKQFYMSADTSLENYEPGRIEHKPILMQQLAEKKRQLEQRQLADKRQMEQKQLADKRQMEQKQLAEQNQLNELRKEYEQKLDEKNILINALIKKIQLLTNKG
jgi:hypothetical protein